MSPLRTGVLVLLAGALIGCSIQKPAVVAPTAAEEESAMEMEAPKPPFTGKRELASQYRFALAMLRGVVNETKEDTWFYTDETKEAAWHIAYHAVYYANIYCSPSEDAVRQWERQSNDCHFLGSTPWPPHERFTPKESFTKADVVEFIDFVLKVIPEYLERLEPEKPCWPHWYKQNQFEFHLNNLRHIQHHTAQLIERNGGASVGWPGVG